MKAESLASQPAVDDQHSFKLLESGERYFPAVLAAVTRAKREILIETFILFEDAVGSALQRELIAAAKRGVHIDLTIDGYGSSNLSDAFIKSLIEVGARIHVYDPQPRMLGMRTNLFRRLHRKLTVVDAEVAFVGGINYAVDQLATRRPDGKLDFAVQVTGPVVATIHRFMQQQVEFFMARRRSPRQRMPVTEMPGSDVEFVVRDNEEHRDDIERRYRLAIHSAQREIILCNAYFFPGYRLLSALRRAARRGVQVTLILQGAPDMPRVKRWEKLLYTPLLDAGVHIHEYVQHPLHAKVAVIDRKWSTVGSSNLDPLSLTLNLEANLVIQHPDFCQSLHARLEQVLQQDCRAVAHDHLRPQALKIALQTVVYHLTRHFPKLAGWLPAHVPRLRSLRKEHLRDMPTNLINGESLP